MIETLTWPVDLKSTRRWQSSLRKKRMLSVPHSTMLRSREWRVAAKLCWKRLLLDYRHMAKIDSGVISPSLFNITDSDEMFDY
jgi:hypothetical protein